MSDNPKATFAIEFELTTCMTCGVPFAVPTELMDQRREDGKNFACPNGHKWSFTSKDDDGAEHADGEYPRLSGSEPPAANTAEVRLIQSPIDGAIHCSCGKRYVVLKSLVGHLHSAHDIEAADAVEMIADAKRASRKGAAL